MSVHRYVCPSCTGVTWNAPEPELCGVCGAIAGLGGNHSAIPCDWCMSNPVREQGLYCPDCTRENDMFTRKTVCNSCFAKEPVLGSTYCTDCLATSFIDLLPSEDEAPAKPAKVYPSFREESRLYPVG